MTDQPHRTLYRKVVDRPIDDDCNCPGEPRITWQPVHTRIVTVYAHDPNRGMIPVDVEVVVPDR